MAKLKRYDLYEGDDEYISLPGKQPLGRDKDLKERDEYDRRAAAEEAKTLLFSNLAISVRIGLPDAYYVAVYGLDVVRIVKAELVHEGKITPWPMHKRLFYSTM